MANFLPLLFLYRKLYRLDFYLICKNNTQPKSLSSLRRKMWFHQCSDAQTQLVAKLITVISTRQGGWNQGNQGVHAPSTFLQNKEIKKEMERQKNKYFFNEEAIIKPASRSKCFCFSHSNYSKIFHGPLNWKCISLALLNKSVVGSKSDLNN